MKRYYHFFLLILFSFTASSQVSTRGKEFWISFMENLDLGGNGQPQFSILISSDVNTSGSIMVPKTGFTITYTVAANQTTEVTLPTNIYYPQGDETVFDFGLQVISQDSVSVYAFHHRMYFSEASIVLPVGELGTDYMIMAKSDDSNVSACEFIVEATEDSTEIEITPSALTLSFRGPGTPFDIWLNKGQVLQIQSYGDLTGTIVKSLNTAKKIAVFSGAKRAAIACNVADDHLYEQLYPVSSWGTQFIAFPFYNHNDLLRVLALTTARR